MSREEAVRLHTQGLRMVHSGHYNEALDFFTKAIELDPGFAAAYQNRGEVLQVQGHLVEANVDLQTAKDLRSGKVSSKKSDKKNITKLNMAEIENIYDTVYPDGSEYDEEDTIKFEEDLVDYVFSDDSLEADDVWDGLTRDQDETKGVPAILEYLGGEREELLHAQLFKPQENQVSIVDEDGNVDRIVPLENVCCIRLTDIPANIREPRESVSHIEIIETVDGNIFHEAIDPQLDFESGLFGMSTKERTRFKYSYFPKVNIKRRCQKRYLGDILLEKRFITENILKDALNELQQLKEMKFGKIIAMKAQISHSEVEEEIAKAQQGPLKGLKIGEILLASGMVNEQQVLESLEYQEGLQQKLIGQFLVEKGILKEREVYISLSEKFRIPFIDLRKVKVNRKILSLLPPEAIVRYTVMPVALQGSALIIATALPDPSTICEDILKYSLIPDIKFVLAQPSHLKNVVHLLYKTSGYMA